MVMAWGSKQISANAVGKQSKHRISLLSRTTSVPCRVQAVDDAPGPISSRHLVNNDTLFRTCGRFQLLSAVDY